MVGAILDGLVIGGVSLVIITLLLGRSILHANPGENPFRYMIMNMVVFLCVFLVVQGYLLATRGQTVAKALLGMRIVGPGGEKVSAVRVIGLRYGIGWFIGIVPLVGGIYGLVDALMIFRESRRCIHDSIANTIVVKA